MARKKPSQERSKNTVEAILEATAHILSKSGFDALNTNQIAKIAGVSIGSVYQFFKNKNSIMEELFLRVSNENLELFLQAVEEMNGNKPELRPIVSGVIHQIIESHEKKGLSGMLFLELLPLSVLLRRFQKIDEEIIPKILKLLEERGIRLRPEDPETALFVVLQAVRAVTSITLATKQNRSIRERIERELTDLCVTYLEAR